MLRKISFILGICVIFFLMTFTCFSAVLFQDDFEGAALDKTKWLPTAGWKLVTADGPAVLGKNVLYIDGGEAGISVKNDFSDFQYEADFRSGTGYSGFVFNAQDNANNFYMHQISVTGSGHTPNNMRWHWKVAGTWNVEPIPFMNGVELKQKVWYHVKFIVEGVSFKVWVVETDQVGKKNMVQIGDWTDKSANFKKGAIGFRSSGGEIMEYDNVVVKNIEPLTAVQLGTKLPTTWSRIKTGN